MPMPQIRPAIEMKAARLDFSNAAASGNKEEVIRMLAPDVMAVSDGGGLVKASLHQQ